VVTAFNLSKDHFLKYEVQVVGGVIHEELWVPAEELADFNDQIVDGIQVVNVYFGTEFVMPENEEVAAVLEKFKCNANG
jgi:hypothetical protein